GYLTNSDTADSQIDSAYCPYIGRLAPGGSIQLNAVTFANDWAGNHFIMCGVSNGTGGLNLTIADGSGNVLAQTTAYLQIQDIKQMYERWTVGDQPSRVPMTNAVLASDGLPAFTMPFEYTPPQDTNTPYILYVHGWNMETWEKNAFAESAFKRLYWQGYQGRFGVFRWPTTYGFTGSFWQALTDPESYDNGEFNAWQSAQGLLNKLEDLNAEYPGHVYMLAHSMGNVVAGEALRLAAQSGSGQIVNTYVASQAAISAHNYDATVTTPYLLPFTYKYPSGFLSLLGTNNYGPYAPDIYVNRLTNNVVAVGKRISFYNVNDFALAMPRWGFDSILKPDHPIGGYYYYSGSISDPSPWNNFEFIFTTGDPPPSPTYFDIVNSLHDRYEVMAYAAPSYSTALGATPNVLNISENLDLTTVWPPDSTGNDYTEHFWHSAEFRGDYWQEQGYWHTLLFSSTYGFNISP
ncbi:MAG: alpha/beta hydrolase, partial [Limisphaerales bacterium]